MGMSSLASHTINVANNSRGRITNLELQKVLYFIIGDYISNHGIDEFIKSVYDEKMEAWQYGPVLRSEYFKNSIYGSTKIRRKAEYNDEYNVFDKYINQRINENLGDLIDDSHKHRKWRENKEDILNQHKRIFYDLEDFEYEFSA